jgi:hypothetical protein
VNASDAQTGYPRAAVKPLACLVSLGLERLAVEDPRVESNQAAPVTSDEASVNVPRFRLHHDLSAVA